MSAPPVAQPQKRGCLFYGCLTLAVVVVIFGVLGYLGVQYARKSVSNLVENYTDSKPAKFEVVQLPQEEANDLEQRVTAFQKALDSQREQYELVLSERELNALVSKDPDLKGKLHARIDGDQIHGEISLPLQDIGPLKLNGRYLNGLATLKASVADGRLVVTVDNLQVNGKPLPANLLNELKKKNLAEEAMKDPEAAKTLSKLHSIEVRDSKVILRTKPKQATP